MTIESEPESEEGKRESLGRFGLRGGHVLTVFSDHEPSRKQGPRNIFFETSLATPLRSEQEVAERAYRISCALDETGRVPSGDRSWLTSMLKGVYFSLAFTSSPNWDLRQALSIPVRRGRPTVADARDLYLALYVKFGQACEGPWQAITEATKAFRLGEAPVERASKKWNKDAETIVTELLDNDEANGFHRLDVIRDYQKGLSRAIERIANFNSGKLPGIEEAASPPVPHH